MLHLFGAETRISIRRTCRYPIKLVAMTIQAFTNCAGMLLVRWNVLAQPGAALRDYRHHEDPDRSPAAHALDSEETVEEIRAHNARYRAACAAQ